MLINLLNKISSYD